MKKKREKLNKTTLMKDGPIKKTLLTLAIPSMIGMIASALYNLVDTIFVGWLHDTNSMAAVSVSFPVFVVLMAIGLLIGVGAASCVGRLLGASKHETANRAGGLAVLLSIIFSIGIMILGFVFMDGIMTLMGASNEVLPYAKAYSNWLLIGAIFTITNLVLNNLLRTEGASQMSMYTIIVGAVANIILDPIFMWGLNLGLAGAAIATAISQAISTLLMAAFYMTKKSHIQLNLHTIFKPTSEDRDLLKQIFAVGIPVFITQFLAAVAFMILNSAAAIFGAPALAAMGIVNKIYTILSQMINGYTNAYLPFASFNVGAKQYKRVKSALFFSLFVTFTYSIILIIIINIVPEFFIKLFSTDPEVIELGVNCLKIQTYLLMGFAFIALMTATFQSLGETKKTAILSLGRQGILMIPLTFILPRIFANSVPAIFEKLGAYPMAPGLYGIMLAQPLADLITLILCGIFCSHTLKTLNQLSNTSEEAEQDVSDVSLKKSYQ